MSSDRTAHQLQVDQDLKFEKAEWKAERVGWIVMAILLLAGLAGLLGPGPLSARVAGDPASRLWIEYNKFERRESPCKVILHVTPGSTTSRIRFSQDFVRNVQIEHVDPEPERTEAAIDGYSFPFAFRDTRTESVVTVYYRPDKIGTLDTEVTVENGPSVRFSQIVYP